jgi:hypothetical protein
MSETHRNDDQYTLKDGANFAVIGGGPTGSFFSIFALKMAKMIGKELQVTIFERCFTGENKIRTQLSLFTEYEC